MKKRALLLLPFLLAAPETLLAAEENAPVNHVLEAAAYQQGEAADTSPPVAAAQPAAQPAAQQAAVAPAAAAAPKPDITDAASKSTLAFSEQVVNLQAGLNQLEDRQNAFAAQLSQLQYGVAVLSGVILVLAFLLLRGKKKSKAAAKKAVKIKDDTRTEYDFMGSHEGIPAKLDLARAYIAMEDYTSARETLSEILGEGNEEQRQEAKILLSKIKE